MDPFLIRLISSANCYCGEVDDKGNPRRIKPSEALVLKAVAEGMTCGVKLRAAVSKSAAEARRGQYSNTPVVSELIEIVENNKMSLDRDGAYINVRLDKNGISDIATRCKLSYKRCGDIIRLLLDIGVLGVIRNSKGQRVDIVVNEGKLEKRDTVTRRKFI